MKKRFLYQPYQLDGQYCPVYIYNIGTDRIAHDIICNWHKEVEVIFVRHGSLRLCIDDIFYDLKAGDIGIINSNRTHYGISSEDTDYDYLVVLFLLNDLISSMDHTERHLHDLANDMLFFPPVIEAGHDLSDSLVQLLCQIESCYNVKSFSAIDLKIKALLFEFIFQFASHEETLIQKSDGDNVKSNEKIQKLLDIEDYIDKHYMEKISVASLASSVYMSHEAFYKFMKQTTGCPPIEYINRFRLEKAIDLLDSSNLSVTDICFETGFNNVSYFIHQFRKAYGITPKQYSKRKAYIDRVYAKPTQTVDKE